MKSKIEAIRTAICTEPIIRLSDELFAGAGLIVSPIPVAMQPGKTVVVSEHARLLSTLIFQLQAACSDWLDHLNKYDFYTSLGEAANDFPSDTADLRGLLLHVVDAALDMDDRYNRDLYFAYGSNMDEDQMAMRCPDAKVIGGVTVKGWRFALDAAGVATILPDEASSVEGVLWSVTPDDIINLDRYEGVKKNCYSKESIRIDAFSEGQTSLVYISKREPVPQVHRDNYMPRIIRAAKEHGFSKDYINTLMGFLTENER